MCIELMALSRNIKAMLASPLPHSLLRISALSCFLCICAFYRCVYLWKKAYINLFACKLVCELNTQISQILWYTAFRNLYFVHCSQFNVESLFAMPIQKPDFSRLPPFFRVACNKQTAKHCACGFNVYARVK